MTDMEANARIATLEAALARVEAKRDEARQINRDYLNTPVGTWIARAEKAEAEVERLKAGVKDFLDGNYPHPRSHRPGKCPHEVWYYDECPTCNEAHFERLLSPNRAEALSELARMDGEALDGTPLRPLSEGD